MRLLSNRTVVAVVAVIVAASVLAGERAVAAAAADDFSAIPGTTRSTTDVDMGEFSSPNMAVDVVLAPNNEAELSGLLASVYDPQSQSYRHWLGQGEFYSRFAPRSAQVAALTDYLQASGLVVEPSSSPFLLRVSGPSSAVAAAFKTTLRNYRNSRGVTYFFNASAVQLPTTLALAVRGVVGLSNTVRMHPKVLRPMKQAPSSDSGLISFEKMSPVPSCETPYVTTAQLFAYANNNTAYPSGYGGGPGCNGLTPSQDNSIYGAPNLGASGKGLGVTLAVFELSAYLHSDIATWAHYFYGPAFTPPLVDVTVDGGPRRPICPAGDSCPPDINGYSGDVEVDADIETDLAISPDARHIIVYNAPNDFTGQTSLDEYTKIADDDIADVVSSSWGVCENDVSGAYVQAENVIFEQMALQGQSMFSAAGDSGAFDCIDSDGTTIVNVDDPPSQPWVTSVGGTSFVSFNPDANPKPSYPSGVETVLNVDNLCSSHPPSPANDNRGGFFWCSLAGAGGGGNSQYWGRPFYQFGPGINNPYTTHGNGTTHCALAEKGTPCREVPDISANADPNTGYAEFCTGSAATPYSACATFSGAGTPPGWFLIGGTSLSSPLWSAIFADHDSFWNYRIGNANPLLYSLYNLDYDGYFNDITGIGQATHNNGLFPTTPGYDLATGIGTPKMGALITLDPQR
jgi:subtilase family serine protease